MFADTWLAILEECNEHMHGVRMVVYQIQISFFLVELVHYWSC